jgi:Domain of unknown function (DUF4157)
VIELAGPAPGAEERPPTLRERLEEAFTPEPESEPEPEPVVEAEPELEPEPELELPTLRERIVQQAPAEAPVAKLAAPEPAVSAEEPPQLEEESAEPVVVIDEEKQRARLAVAAPPEEMSETDDNEPPTEEARPQSRPRLTLLPGGLDAQFDAPERTIDPVARGPPPMVVQRKLSISSPGDALEAEADSVALRVLRGERSVRGKSLSSAPSRAPPAADPALPRSVAAVVTAPGGGRPLDAALRKRIEPELGVDLSDVRVRRGPDAAAAARDLRARAFTSGSTIFLAKESSPSDIALMAHEATHVVQQQHSARARASLLRDLSDYLPDISVSDLIPDWILDGVRSLVRAIPGYTLLTYITGKDPLSDEPVTVGRQELIDTLLTYGPFGPAVGPVLEAIDVLGEVFDFVSSSLAEHDLTFDRIKRDVENAWHELSVTNGIAGNVAIVRRYVDAFLRDVRAFVISIVDRVLEMVRAVVAQVAEPLLETPEIAPVWNLTKKVLHYDPLRGTEVNAPTAEIIADFLRLIGQEQRLQQMEERGTLQQTADWLDTQLATFASLVGELGSIFSDAWAAIQPANLPDLMTNLQSLAQRVFGFIQRVADFAATLILKILELIKDALLGWLSENAHRVPGFHLLTVIIGQNPFTGEVVPRTAENLIKGFITLMPNGEATYDQLAQSGVIGDAAGRIEGEMARLGISLEMVSALFHGIWDTLSLDDLLDPIGAFERIIALFGEPLSRLIEFVGVVVQVVIELVLRLMNFPSDLLASIISNALQAIEDIKRDPVQFIKNMLEAVRLGFTNFFDNILTYLVQGLGAWLFRGLGQLGITIPPDLSFMSILTLVLQVLGITAEHLWQKLGEHIGPDRVAMIRSAINMLTGAWEFIKDVQENGISAVWRFLADQLSNLWDTLLGMAKDWIMTTIIRRVTAKLLSMLDPTGIMAVVNSFIAFFNAVQSAIEYLREILEIVNRWVSTLAAVAAGNIVPGAQMLEQGLAAAVPVAIGFLANQVGLGNVPEKIVEIIGGLRQLVDQAIDWLIETALRLGQAVLNALGLGQQPAGAEDPDALVVHEPFQSEGNEHELDASSGGALTVSSNHATPLSAIVDPTGQIATLNTQYLAARQAYDAAVAARRANPSAQSGYTTRRDEVKAIIDQIVARLSALHLDDAPGASAPGLGDIRLHGEQVTSLRSGPRVWWLESEHVIPFAVGKYFWDAVGEEIPIRGRAEDKGQTTIMIYEPAADKKTRENEPGLINDFKAAYNTHVRGPVRSLQYVLHGGGAQTTVGFAAQYEAIIDGLDRAVSTVQGASVTATTTAIAWEHGQADSAGTTNGAKRAETAPLPAAGDIQGASNQQHQNLHELAEEAMESLQT